MLLVYGMVWHGMAHPSLNPNPTTRDCCERTNKPDNGKQVTRMSLKQLYVNGKNPEPAHRLANAQFLHKELPVRLSQRAVELMNLPHGLSDAPGVQQVSYVHGCFEVVFVYVFGCVCVF